MTYLKLHEAYTMRHIFLISKFYLKKYIHINAEYIGSVYQNELAISFWIRIDNSASVVVSRKIVGSHFNGLAALFAIADIANMRRLKSLCSNICWYQYQTA